MLAQSCPTLFATLWTVAHWAPLSMGFPRQEYWSGLPFLLHGIFPIERLYLGLLPWRQILYLLNFQGSPTGEWVYRAKIQVRVWETVEQGQNPEMRGLCLVKHRGVPRQLWGGKEQMKRIKLTTIKVGNNRLSRQVGGVSHQRLLPRVGFCMPRWADRI